MEVKKSEIPNDMGVIRIADEVVSTVSGLAAIEVEGVASMSGGWGLEIAEKLGKKSFGKGIKVEVNDDQTKIDIFISVKYGYSIPKVAEGVQQAVKTAVETMTGLLVTSVNVHVVSVSMNKAEQEENSDYTGSFEV